METKHLRLCINGLVWLRLPDAEDLLLGCLADDSECPVEYLDEWAWLRSEDADRERFAAGCRREALVRDLDPRGWR